jgi:FkbM family methyltransferase
MKALIKKILQRILGFDNYLYIFSLFTIYTLKWNKNEKDFLFFLKLIPNEGIVLDIGANIGIMTAHLCRKLKNVTVYAFEPMPNNLKALQRIIRFFHLKNVKVMDFALGNEEGSVEMVMPVVDSVKMQGLSHVVHDSIEEFNEGTRFKVAVRKLDNLKELTESDKRVTAIKMDVENFEFFVLDGAKNLIRKHKPLIYTELWENENRDKCLNLIRELGYGVKVIQEGSLVDFDSKRHSTQNFFFIPIKE